MFQNGTFLTDVAKSSKDEQKTKVDVQTFMDYIGITFYMLTVVIGVPGNSVVIWMAGFRLQPKVTNVWLVNLAVADLIFCFTRSLSLVKKLFFDYWPYGEFFCKFNGFFKYTNMFCSVFLLSIISLDRMLCVWRPVFTKQRRTVFAARVVSACVWIAAIAFSTPYFFSRNVYYKNNQTKCSTFQSKEVKGGETFKMALYYNRFLCGFLLPFLVILTCYVLTAIGIRRTRLSRKARPLRILAALVIAFFLCWAPYHCLLLVKMVNSENKVLKIWQPLATGMAFSNSCVNPMLYFCMGLDVRSQFRQSLVGIYKKALVDDVEGPTTQSRESEGCSVISAGPNQEPVEEEKLLSLSKTVENLTLVFISK